MADRGIVVITGASTGIGAACAVGLAKRGYTVFAGVRRPEDASAGRSRSTASDNSR
ncbi:MAG: SDR family NAD(P)-dependent oxidoreductase [Polyangiales bacterium]